MRIQFFLVARLYRYVEIPPKPNLKDVVFGGRRHIQNFYLVNMFFLACIHKLFTIFKGHNMITIVKITTVITKSQHNYTKFRILVPLFNTRTDSSLFYLILLAEHLRDFDNLLFKLTQRAMFQSPIFNISNGLTGIYR